jgi:hypothetical protein
VNDSYTVFELWVRLIFLFVAFLSLMLLTIFLRHFKWIHWTIEQKYNCIGLSMELMLTHE